MTKSGKDLSAPAGNSYKGEKRAWDFFFSQKAMKTGKGALCGAGRKVSRGDISMSRAWDATTACQIYASTHFLCFLQPMLFLITENKYRRRVFFWSGGKYLDEPGLILSYWDSSLQVSSSLLKYTVIYNVHQTSYFRSSEILLGAHESRFIYHPRAWSPSSHGLAD